MAAFSLSNATLFARSTSSSSSTCWRRRSNSMRPRIVCTWDPEGILGPPQTGHVSRMQFKQKFDKDSEAREAFQPQVAEEKERRRALRQARVVPDTPAGLIEYFLDTEAQELEFEFARLRRRLNVEFFAHLKFELGQLRSAVSKTQDMYDRIIELEAMQKFLLERTEAYYKMQAELVTSRLTLGKILTSKDVKATLLDMVERNKLNRSVLTLLDENIATAQSRDSKQAIEFMEKVRAEVLKYLTV